MIATLEEKTSVFVTQFVPPLCSQMGQDLSWSSSKFQIYFNPKSTKKGVTLHSEILASLNVNNN